jgi:hypothetical protein
MSRPINYVRLERELTDSWITFRLWEPMRWDSAETYEALMTHLAFVMPGWELVSACEYNPDDIELQANDHWPGGD